MQAIQHIIFDLGGVIINIDYQKTVNAFHTLAPYDSGEYYLQHKQHILFDELEIGSITPDAFRKNLRRLLKTEADDEMLDKAWNALLLDIPAERIELLKKLSKQKHIFLLSNTNEIHKTAFDRQVKRQFGMDNIDSLFEKAYYSHLVGDRKPNLSIFQKVLRENNLLPEQTLFIDDSIQHIRAASQLGIKALHLKDRTILDLHLTDVDFNF